MNRLILFLFLLIPGLILSQSRYQTTSKKAIKNFELALKYFDSRNDLNAIKYLEKALKADTRFIEAYMMLAQIYKDREDNTRAISYFETGLDINPYFNPGGYLILATVEFNEGMYEKALLHANKFISLGIFSKTTAVEGENFIRKCTWAINQVKNPVPFNPVNLGDSINSDKSE